MNENEYYAVVRRLGLNTTQFAETFVTAKGDAFSVPLASTQTAEQRTATIGRIKERLGIK